jgi:hypothetical protein
LRIPDFVELIAVSEFDEQVGDIFGDVQIRPPEVFSEAFLGQRSEELAEWMAARNGISHLDLPGDPCPLKIV